MLFISHDLAVVAQAANQPGDTASGRPADQVAVMQHGHLVEQASTHDLFHHPRHPYTRKLLASVPTMQTNRNHPLATLS
jgi:peptide/nickel transport system ATP-binding protein